jgi:hypothetical protein
MSFITKLSLKVVNLRVNSESIKQYLTSSEYVNFDIGDFNGIFPDPKSAIAIAFRENSVYFLLKA